MTDRGPHAGDWIALYGTLMRGLGGRAAAGVEERLRYVGPCVIRGELYDLGAYPGLRPGDGRVVAELHRVGSPDVFTLLDAFEGFAPGDPEGSLFVRERVPLVEPAGTSAWLYVYNRRPDARCRIPTGDWRAHRERWGDPAFDASR